MGIISELQARKQTTKTEKWRGGQRKQNKNNIRHSKKERLVNLIFESPIGGEEILDCRHGVQIILDKGYDGGFKKRTAEVQFGACVPTSTQKCCRDLRQLRVF
jgi:hypothetical protein